MSARILSGAVEFRGTGLFTGAPANVSIRSAPAGAGITFVSDGSLRGVGVALMLGGAVACFVTVASLAEEEPSDSTFPTPGRD